MAWTPASPGLLAENFQTEINAHPLVVVHFWADWNLIDQRMDKVIQKVRPEFNEIKFFAFDTTPEDSWDTAQQFGILNLPALLCFLDGEPHEMRVGFLNARQLRAKLSEWLAAST